jgi:Mycotoxin biosynthesis protein UstYa
LTKWFLYKYVHKDHYFAGASSQQEAILKYHSRKFFFASSFRSSPYAASFLSLYLPPFSVPLIVLICTSTICQTPEHCLNTLRKFAMCHGDVGLVTYSWLPNSLKPAANGTAHQCIDWDRLADWSKRRAVNMSEPGFLIHPTLGTSISIYLHFQKLASAPCSLWPFVLLPLLSSSDLCSKALERDWLY